jgi:hypothetical protein
MDEGFVDYMHPELTVCQESLEQNTKYYFECLCCTQYSDKLLQQKIVEELHSISSVLVR